MLERDRSTKHILVCQCEGRWIFSDSVWERSEQKVTGPSAVSDENPLRTKALAHTADWLDVAELFQFLLQWESLRGGRRSMPSHQKWELASRKCMNCGVIRRERWVNEPTVDMAFKLGACDKQHGKHFLRLPPTLRLVVLHSQLRRGACQRIDAARGRGGFSGTYLHLRFIRTAMQTLRRASLFLLPPPFSSAPFLPCSPPAQQQHLLSGKS